MYAIHEVFVEVVASLSGRQFREGRCQAAAVCSQGGRTTRSPEGKIGLGRANIMLARALRRIATIAVLARSASGVFEREEWEIKEQRVQLETLKRYRQMATPTAKGQRG